MTFRHALLLGAASIMPAMASAQTGPTAPAPATQPAPVIVPAGCTAQTQAGGQVVVLCPAAPTPSGAPAGPAPPATAAPPYVPERARTQRKWYGWQTLIVDGAVVVSSIALGAASTNGSAGSSLFLGGYVLGGPIVHWANGEVGRGFGSLGLRLGAPVVGGMVGGLLGAVTVGSRDGNDDIDSIYGFLAGAVLGVGAGAITAVAVDSAVLARKTVTVDAAEARRQSLRLKWAPTGGYDPRRQAFQVGIGGTF